MDYQSEEFQRNKISHKKRFFNVLNELIHSRKNKHVYETMRVKHEYAEFLQHLDFRRDLKEMYPDLVASFGQKLWSGRAQRSIFANRGRVSCNK